MGPLIIKSGKNIRRVFVVISACVVTRAIHLEIACDTSAFEFLKVLRCFCSIGNCLKHIVTDNASTFVFIQPMVGDEVGITSSSLQEHCYSKQILTLFAR